MLGEVRASDPCSASLCRTRLWGHTACPPGHGFPQLLGCLLPWLSCCSVWLQLPRRPWGHHSPPEACFRVWARTLVLTLETGCSREGAAPHGGAEPLLRTCLLHQLRLPCLAPGLGSLRLGNPPVSPSPSPGHWPLSWLPPDVASLTHTWSWSLVAPTLPGVPPSPRKAMLTLPYGSALPQD